MDMTPSPLPMVLKMLSACQDDRPIVETMHLPVEPAKTIEFTKLLDELMTAMHKAPGLGEVRTHTPTPGSNEYLIYQVWDDATGLRLWWEGLTLRKFQAALHERGLLTGMPSLHFNHL